jgi:lipoprotein-anchoring transpeptidase ErfK/SrfK
MTREPRPISRVTWAGAVAALTVLLAACQGSTASPGPDSSSSGTSSSTTSATSTPAELEVSPSDGSTDVAPDSPVTVSATTGSLTSVKVKDGGGDTIAGSETDSGAWRSTAGLKPATKYTVVVKATGPDGTPTRTRSTFRTHTPAITATYGIVYNGNTVGVGMPVSIQFDSEVTTERFRAAVQKRVSVTTTPKQAGAWGWLDNRQLMWRPKSYWKPGTQVTIDAPLTGVQTGPDKWVANDTQGSMTVGDSMVSHVNIKTHEMTVRKNGKVIKTIPVSTGKPGPKTETRSGTKVIIGKEGKITMDSATVGIPKGDPDYYKIDTKWNLRVTWTGEFLHSAPWSVDAQGTENVSHGCTNMSPANAKWMFKHSTVGDVVTFTGSSRIFQPAEGIGVWQYSYSGWKDQSALRG